MKSIALAVNARRCSNCASFSADAHLLESALPGLNSLGSAWAAVRAGDGLCADRGRFVSRNDSCAAHRT